IGRRLVDPGNLVKADDTILASLVARDPMYVFFDVDERTLLRLRRGMQEGKLKAEKMPVAIRLADEEGYSQRGVVDFTDNQVNPQTGTIRLRAVLPNKDKLLSPGMFVRARLLLGEPHKALMIPERSVRGSVMEGWIVLVVNEQNVIERRQVEVGKKDEDRRVV